VWHSSADRLLFNGHHPCCNAISRMINRRGCSVTFTPTQIAIFGVDAVTLTWHCKPQVLRLLIDDFVSMPWCSSARMSDTNRVSFQHFLRSILGSLRPGKNDHGRVTSCTGSVLDRYIGGELTTNF
jgi:hypothetical protein